MANVVVVGSQWGDEGKGKIVDWLSERADVVVRFPGRPQCRPYPGDRRQVTYKLSLLPSGVVRSGKLVGDRQRRGDRPLGAGRRNRPAHEQGWA